MEAGRRPPFLRVGAGAAVPLPAAVRRPRSLGQRAVEAARPLPSERRHAAGGRVERDLLGLVGRRPARLAGGVDGAGGLRQAVGEEGAAGQAVVADAARRQHLALPEQLFGDGKERAEEGVDLELVAAVVEVEAAALGDVQPRIAALVRVVVLEVGAPPRRDLLVREGRPGGRVGGVEARHGGAQLGPHGVVHPGTTRRIQSVGEEQEALAADTRAKVSRVGGACARACAPG